MTHPRISATEAHHRMREDGYVYLDVRTAEEFALGHPQGAYNVPFLLNAGAGVATNPEFVRVVQATFATSEKIVVGCQTGDRSRHASAALLAAGYTTLLEQRAGYAGARDAFGRVVEPGWQALGLPSSVHAEPGRAYAALRARA